MTLAVVEPTSLIAVSEQCNAIETWAERCESIPELRDASNKLAAIDEYLARTSTEGRALVAATQRRLEVRIGKLLGPATVGAHSSATEGAELTRHERTEFRKMADHADVVEHVIADSTDEKPASRRKVTEAINKKRTTTSRRRPLVDSAQDIGWSLRRGAEQLDRLHADDRFAANKEEVAARLRGHLTFTVEVCQDLLDLFGQPTTKEK